MAEKGAFGLGPLDSLIAEYEQQLSAAPGLGSGPQPTTPQTSEPEIDVRHPTKAPSRARGLLPPTDMVPMFEAASQKYDVPVNVLMALAQQESSYDPGVRGVPTQYGRALGLMQYLPSTAKMMGINPFDTEQSIDAAARQLKDRLNKGYSMEDAVKEHFAGPDRRQWGPKTAQYGVDVLHKARAIGSQMYGGDGAASGGMPDLRAQNPFLTQGNMSTRQDGPMSVPAGTDTRTLPAVDVPAAQEQAQTANYEDRSWFDKYVGDRLKSGWTGMRAGLAANIAEGDARIINVIDRIDRGEKVRDADDPLGYQYMDADLRAKTKDDLAKNFLEKIGETADLRKQQAQIPQNPEVQAALQAKTFSDFWEHFKKAPVTFIANVGVESAPAMLPGLAAGGVLGIGLRAGAAGFGAGMGAGSYAVDYQSSVLDALNDLGVDPTNKTALEKAFRDPATMEQVRKLAHAHASVVGALDAASGGLAGKEIIGGVGLARKIANVGAQTVAQGTLGAAGEAGGQLAQGKKDLDAGQVAAEFLGEAVTAPVEVAGALKSERRAGTTSTDGNVTVTVPDERPTGPVGRALQAGADDAAARRVVVTAPDGSRASGFLDDYRDDGQGGFVARVLADDGTALHFSSADGVTITPERDATPALPAPTITVDGAGRAATTEQRQQRAEQDQAAAEASRERREQLGITPDVDRAAQAHRERERLPESLKADQPISVVTRDGEVIDGTAKSYERTEDGARLTFTDEAGQERTLTQGQFSEIIKREASDAKPADGVPVHDDGAASPASSGKKRGSQPSKSKTDEADVTPARTATVAEPEQRSDEGVAGATGAREAEPALTAPRALEDMTLDDLIKHREYLSTQARNNGGWNKPLTREKARVETAIRKLDPAALDQFRTPAERAKGDDAPTPRTSSITTPQGKTLIEFAMPDGDRVLVRQDHFEDGRAKLTTFNNVGTARTGPRATVMRTSLNTIAEPQQTAAPARSESQQDVAQVNEPAPQSEFAGMGENAAIQGFSMHPPSNIRKKADRDAWESGWLNGKRKRDIALEGLEPVTVGGRVATPVINARKSVVWRDEAAGKEYDTPEKARAGLEQAVERLKAIDSISPARPKTISKEDADHLFGVDQKRAKALERIAKGRAWFSDQKKARDFITKNGLADTHEVEKTGAKRFEVKAKAQQQVQVEITEQPSPEPLTWAGGDRWEHDRGAMPGEPFAFLDGDEDTAVAAMREVMVPGKGVYFEVSDRDGDLLSTGSTPTEAAELAEKRVDSSDGVARPASESAPVSSTAPEHAAPKKPVTVTRTPGVTTIVIDPSAMSSDQMAVKDESRATPASDPVAPTDRKIEPEPKPADDRFAGNKIFTQDKVAAARARLKSKLNQLNSGFDPEVMLDGIIITGAYLESGVRDFSAYAKEMIQDMGEAVKPYLLSFYEGARNYPGLDTKGMSSVDEAARLHAAMIAPADAQTEAVGEIIKKPGRRSRKTGAKQDMTLTQDWGVDHIDGYSGDADRETGNTVKDAFMKEARSYLNTVAGILTENGYTPHTDAKGRPTKPVSVNESGVAGSGDISLTLAGPDGTGLYVHIGDTALRGVVPTTPSGVAIMFRAAQNGDKYGAKGVNQWAPTDLSAADFAALVDDHVKREAKRNERSATTQDAGSGPARQGAQGVPANEEPGRTGDLFGQPDSRSDGFDQHGNDASDSGPDAVGRSDEARPAGRNGTQDGRGSGAVAGAGSDAAGGDGGRSRAGRADDAGRNDARREPVERQPRPVSAPRNYRIQPGEITREGSWKDTAARNVDIVELVKRLQAENRQATPEEKALLTKFTGWGASEIANGVFPDRFGNYKPGWQELGERLKAALTEQEYADARRSTQYAHYTSEGVIRSIYAGLDRLGFKGGEIAEPGMGIGLFAGLMPDTIAANSTYTGIEFDPITGAIAKQLYPASNVIVGDYTRTNLPGNYFDAAIGNPPFSSTVITNDPEYKRHRFMLHDYFFAKTIDRVRPGGLVVFVTSKGTMDKASDKARKYLAERANLVGAVRLPQTAFKGNAGTEVVTDVLFLQKRGAGVEDNGASWLGLKEVKTKSGEATPVNEYFADHPEMVLGEHALTGSMYRANEYTVEPRAGEDIEQAFAAAVSRLPEGIYNPERGTKADTARVIERDYNPTNRKEGGLYLSERGDLMQVENGSGVPLTQRKGAGGKKMIDLTDKQIGWVKDYVGLRDALKQAQHDQLTDGDWQSSLQTLNAVYDQFVKKHGPILAHSVTERENEDGTTTVTQRFKNKALWEMDAEGALVYALESILPDGTITKAPVFFERVLRRPAQPEIKTTQDAMFVSLNRLGRLDIDDVAKLAGLPREEVIDTLGTAIYEDPSSGWQMADAYLSGNVVRKLEQARAAADLNPKYKRNVDALLAVQPRPLGPTDITVRLGANWVPASDIEAFAQDVLGERVDVIYTPITGDWSAVGRGSIAGSEWAAGDMSPSQILHSVLNSRQIKVTYKDGEGKTHTDPVATEKANDVAHKMKEAFARWIWTDPERADRLTKYYNENFNNIAPRQYDGSHLTLPGVSLRFTLHPHQKRAVWRGIQDGDTYLAHAVGSGKTIEMIASGMEQRRLGLISKPIYTVPNHMLAQFAGEFLELYPTAHIMVADEQNFHTSNRRRFLAQAALNNPDAIIITHSAFGRLGMSDEYAHAFIQRQIDEWKAAMDDVDNSDRITKKQIERRIEQLEKRLEGKQAKETKDRVLTFEELGADYLFVDEMHEFRKLDFATNQGNIKGIDPAGSQRALDLYMKVEYLRSKKPGRSITGASGTPITNTMGELFTVQRFFQPEQLAEDGLDTFDAWAAQYGDTVTALEQNAAGGYETVTRFAKFQNVPELMHRVRSFMDIVTNSQLGELVKRPNVKGGARQIVVTPSPSGYRAYQKTLEERIKAIRERTGPPQKGDDIILNVIADGRFSAMDMRFVDPTLPPDPDSKLNRMLDDLIEAYRATTDNEYTTNGVPDPLKGSTLLVFSDIGLGDQAAERRGFSMRKWMEQRLTDAGIPREHIAFMRDYKQHAKKGRLFADMRDGKKRILIGGKDMETGVNVQKRLTHVFHLDAPWFPSSVEQREGRGVRQGNQNGEVDIRSYATKGSYDSTMWGMNARKARFIEQAMSGDDSVRSLEDVSEASSFEMAAALASGDERYLRLAGLRGDVERLSRLRQAHYDGQSKMRRDRHWAESEVERKGKLLDEIKAAIAKRKPIVAGEFAGKIGKTTFDSREEFSNALFDAFKVLVAEQSDKTTVLGEIGGFDIRFDGLRGERSYMADVHVDVPGAEPILSWPLEEGLAINGLATKAANQVNGLDRRATMAEQDIANAQRKIEQIDARFGAPFAEEADLLDKIAQLNDLETELAAESKDADSAQVAQQAQAEPPSDVSLSVADPKPVDMPDVLVGRALGDARNHPDYAAAKSGDTDAAVRLVGDLLADDAVAQVRAAVGGADAVIVPVLAVEQAGHNKIPLAVAESLGAALGLDVATKIHQSVKAGRSAQGGLDRIFNRPRFAGDVQPGQAYFLVDDTLTQGGTLAALAAHIRAGGGTPIGSFVLTGKQYSSTLRLSDDTLRALREKYGNVEQDFRAATGYGFAALTESEGRYLAKHDSPDAIRNRILAQRHAGVVDSDEKAAGSAQDKGGVDGGAFSATIEGSDVGLSQRGTDAMRAQTPIMVRSTAAERAMSDADLRAKVFGSLRDEKALENPDIGQVSINRSGWSKSRANSADRAKLLSLPYLPQIIRDGIYLGSQPLTKDKAAVGYHYIGQRVNVDGVPLAALVTVEEHRDGSLTYYNHTMMSDPFADGRSIADVDGLLASYRRPIFTPDRKRTRKEASFVSHGRNHEALLNGALGGLVDTLIGQGHVVLHPDENSLPTSIKLRGGAAIQGFTDRTSGVIHLVAESLTPQTAQPVLLHEAFHGHAEKLLGTPKWNNLMGQLGRYYQAAQRRKAEGRVKDGDFWDGALRRIDAAQRAGAISEDRLFEEFGAYAIENYELAPSGIKKWVDAVIGMVKDWLARRFGLQAGDVTPAQLRALAMAALRSVEGTRPLVTQEFNGAAFGDMAMSAQAATDTPAFRKWFGNSKVVDAEGKPLVVYHGTNAEFTTFSPKKKSTNTTRGNTRLGFFFIADRALAEDFARETSGGGRIIDAYLSIQNPIDLTKEGMFSKAEQAPTLSEIFFGDRISDPDEALEAINEEIGLGEFFDLDEVWEQDFALKIMKRDGYDGVISHFGAGNLEYVAFRPEQIKSASGNIGKFDASNPDIMFSVKEKDAALKDAVQTLGGADELESSGLSDASGAAIRDMHSRYLKYAAHPRHIAAMFRDFVPVFKAANDQQHDRNTTLEDLHKDFQAYAMLDQGSKDHVNAVLELGRLIGTVFDEDALYKGVKNPGYTKTVVRDERGEPHVVRQPIQPALSKAGDVLKLNAAEQDAYRALRRMFDRALEKFRDQALVDFGFGEYVGKDKPADAMRESIKGKPLADPMVARTRNVIEFIDDIEQSKRAGYVPFSRYGDYVIAVKERVANIKYEETDGGFLAYGVPNELADELERIGSVYDAEADAWHVTGNQRADLERANERTVYSEKVETGLRDKFGKNAERKVRAREGRVENIPSVKAAIARVEQAHVNGHAGRRIVSFETTQKRGEGGIDMTAVDALAELAHIDAPTWDAVRAELMKALQAGGFRRHFFQASHVPGYTPDFQRAIADYMVGMSGYLARRRFNDAWDKAIAAIKGGALHEYATKYRAYFNDPREEFAMLRQLAFVWKIGANLSSAMVNLTQTFLTTIPTLNQIAGNGVVAMELTRAARDALAMATPKAKTNVFDMSRAPADLREEFAKADAAGLFLPLNSFDLMGQANQRTARARAIQEAANTATSVISLPFSASERFNRIVAFTAAARIAKRKGMAAKIAKHFRNDRWAQDTFGKEFTPYAFAEWLAAETQFQMGKINRPTMMRGAGAAMLQFKSFMLQLLEKMYRDWTLHGAAGKISVVSTLAMLIAFSGLWGAPGADDLRKLLEFFYKQVTGKSIDFKDELRQLLYGATGSLMITDALSSGMPYHFGMDLSQRVGMGDILPQQYNKTGMDTLDMASMVGGPGFDMLVAAPIRATGLLAAGNVSGAIGEVTPVWLKNPIQAYNWYTDAVRTRRGDKVLDRSEISGADVAMKAAGIQPSRVSRQYEMSSAQYNAQRSADDLKRGLHLNLVRALERERANTDVSRKDALRADVDAAMDKIREYNKTAPNDQRISLKPRSVRSMIQRERMGGQSVVRRAPKASREGAARRAEAYGIGLGQ